MKEYRESDLDFSEPPYNPEVIIGFMAFAFGGFIMGIIAAWLIAVELLK